MDIVQGNIHDLKWMDVFDSEGKYRLRKKLFPAQGCTVQFGEFCNGHSLHPHKHEYEQIAIILQGVCDFYVAGKKYRLTEGGYLVIPPYTEHYIHVHDSFVPVMNMDIFIPKRDEYVKKYMDFVKEQEK